MDDLVDKVAEATKDTPPDPEVKTPDVDSWKYDTNYLRLMDYFAIKPDDAHWYKDKLAIVYDWAKLKSNSEDIMDSSNMVKSLFFELNGDFSLTKRV